MEVVRAAKSALPAGETVTAEWRVVSPGYFQTMGIPVLRGRTFSEEDRPTGQPSTIVSQELARRLWPDTDPTGLELTLENKITYRIVGV